MRRRGWHWMSACCVIAGFGFGLCAIGQQPSHDEREKVYQSAAEIRDQLNQTKLQGLIPSAKITMASDADLRSYNALKVAQDLLKSPLRQKQPDLPLLYYVVEPMSNLPRLANQYPLDGELGGTLRVVASKDEFEACSFVLYGLESLKGLQVKASALKTADGAVISADKVDLKVVKIWYQNSNAWYNYFGDFSKKLIPELLVNDETIIRVDTETKDNYLRVNYPSGETYVWISAPEAIDPGFNPHEEPVYDADSIQPVALTAGEFKQFFATIDVGQQVKEGLYHGEIDLLLNQKKIASIPLQVRVLPFLLPQPKTYYDLRADFYTMLYCVPGVSGYFPHNGYDQKLSDEKTLKRFLNQRKHNVTSPLYLGIWNGYQNYDEAKNAVLLAQKAGMKMDPLFEAFGCHASFQKPEAFFKNKRVAEIAKKEFKKLLGHTNLWPAGGEEPGYSRIVGARRDWKTVHELGMKVMCNGGDRRYFSGYSDDFRVGGGFAELEQARFMHQIGGKIGNYAGPHTGPENPDYMRRSHGLNLYKKEYDMMYNYGYHEGGWNDFHTDTYRNMNLVYYTKNGILDTLAWEGIREGIDDIRYATLLKQLAEKAMETKQVSAVYTARKALQFLALLQEDTADLNAARMEMIRHIQAISNELNP